MIDLLLLALVLAASAAAGLALLRALDALPRPPHEHLLAGLATGLGLASMATLGLAALGWLRALPIAACGVVALAAGGALLVQALRAVRLPRGAVAWACVLVCALVLLAEAPTWWAPPVGGDQTKYHLAYPRLYALAGGLVDTPWSFWGQQQWLQNFLFALAYALRGDALARLLNAVSGVLAAVALATLVRRHLGRELGAIAGTLFFTMPMCWSQMVRAGADTSVIIYAALAIAAFLDWAIGRRSGDLRRAGVLAGLAGGAKVMGLLVPALVGIGVLVVLVRRRSAPGGALAAAIVYGVLALALLWPWYLRNAVETGDPMYPFGQAAFPGRNWSNEAGAYLNLYYEEYRNTEAAQRGGRSYAGFQTARFPWDLTMHPESFENGKRQGQDVSPFMLAFLPAVLLVRRRRAAVLTVTVLGLAYAGIIAAGAWAHPRYVLPGLALVLAGTVAGARALCGSRRLLLAVVALTVAGNLALTTRLLRPMWPDQVRVALGLLSPDVFQRRYSQRYVFWYDADQLVPETGRVIVLEKIPHPYYIDRPFVLLSYLEQGLVDYRTVNTVPALRETARKLGATHVAVDDEGLTAAADPYEAQVTALWRAFVAELGQPLLRAGGYSLYTLPDAAGGGHA